MYSLWQVSITSAAECWYVIYQLEQCYFKMPSKKHQQRQCRRNRHVTNSIVSNTENTDGCSTQHFTNEQNFRKTDKTEIKREHHRDVMRRIRKQNTAYVNRNREKTKANVKRRLASDESYRQKDRECAMVNTARRLASDKSYRQKNRKCARANTVRRLASDESYRQKNRECARVNKVRRLASDELYRQKNVQRSRRRMRRLLQDEQYREKNRLQVASRMISDSMYTEKKTDGDQELERKGYWRIHLTRTRNIRVQWVTVPVNIIFN